MDEIRSNVSEKQTDVLAGRVAELERKMEALLDVLAGTSGLQQRGVHKAHFADIRRTFLTCETAELRHYNERARAIREARRDELADSLEFVKKELGQKLPARSRRAPAQASPGRSRRNRGRGRVA